MKQQGTPEKTIPTTATYKRLQIDFRIWLETLGYSKSTVYSAPRMTGEFLCWMERKKLQEVKEIRQQLVDDFMVYFQYRSNEVTGGGLSTGHINKQITSLQYFFKYLQATQNIRLGIVLRQLKKDEFISRIVLSKEEIQELYRATDNSLIGIRDRAMLSIYYGCGLRRSEGINLEVSDVLFERRLLYVRKAKNGYERYVPMNVRCMQDLESYIYTARPMLIDTTKECETLFISVRGKPIDSQSFKCRLEVLKEKSGNTQLKNKHFGLHALRHSIATHLLEAGINLENVALFLGHKTLDSTQIYTHLINEK